MFFKVHCNFLKSIQNAESISMHNQSEASGQSTVSGATDWQVFQLENLVSKVENGTLSMREFLRTPSLSCSIYHVPAGSKDMASAHEEDELYLILDGCGRLRVGDSEQQVTKGSIMYVQAACDHTFFDVEENITALVFFGAPIRHLRGR
ncbi:hypothetical protein ThidrDRAFT_1770 [Thiorhodococcus drewsii AZ1]|uniref:Cupin type-2 domain-containing protein n=2 Tax=Thiorhodococcus drewsii TaxID=210408 RepID=G2E0F7_9GAMM|nr:hypothetical protein ThidrDRAFT_1770 [Thiorhodococcus drewsii AZ1]